MPKSHISALAMTQPTLPSVSTGIGLPFGDYQVYLLPNTTLKSLIFFKPEVTKPRQAHKKSCKSKISKGFWVVTALHQWT